MADEYSAEMTLDEYHAMLDSASSRRRANKYGARACVVDGIRFDSRKEAGRYQELKLLAVAGDIRDLRLHPVYELQAAFTSAEGERIRAVSYEADFEYVEVESGQRVAEDVKSPATRTPLFEVKRKLFLARFPGIRLRVVE